MERVLKRDKLSLDGNHIVAKELVAPQSPVVHGLKEPLMLYVMGDLSKLSEDTLSLYLEDVANAPVTEVVYGTKEGFALVIFDSKPGMKICIHILICNIFWAVFQLIFVLYVLSR